MRQHSGVGIYQVINPVIRDTVKPIPTTNQIGLFPKKRFFRIDFENIIGTSIPRKFENSTLENCDVLIGQNCKVCVAMVSNQILVRPKKTLKNQLKNYRGMELKMELSEVHFKGHTLEI